MAFNEKEKEDFESRYFKEKNLELQLKLWQAKKFFSKPVGFPLEIKKKILDIIKKK